MVDGVKQSDSLLEWEVTYTQRGKLEWTCGTRLELKIPVLTKGLRQYIDQYICVHIWVIICCVLLEGLEE